MKAQNQLYRTLAVAYLGGKCVVCGTDKKLAIHHKDGNPFNSDPANLALACPAHHKELNREARRLRPKAHVAAVPRVASAIIHFASKVVRVPNPMLDKVDQFLQSEKAKSLGHKSRSDIVVSLLRDFLVKEGMIQ